jgi:hypothetical protein
MKSRDLAYPEDPTAYLVAGRSLRGTLTPDGLARLCAELDDLGARWGGTLVALPGTLGLFIDYVGTWVEPVDRLALLTELFRACDLPWEDIARLVADTGDAVLDLAAKPRLYLSVAGPQAGGFVGYGVVTDLADDYHDEAEFRAAPYGAAARVPGLDLVRGNGLDKLPQPEAVYGTCVARGRHDLTQPVPVDLSPAAHQVRIARLGALADRSGYHLIGCFG